MRTEPEPSDPAEPQRTGAYKILPAAGFHLLTPWFDLLAGVTGVGRRFKARAVDLAEVEDGMRVLEVGCGSGVTALLLKQLYPRSHVVGLDADPRILEIARRRLIKARVGGVDLVCARAEATAVKASSVDAALSLLTFHHLPPRAKRDAAREIARVLRPSGTFLLVDLRPLVPVRRMLTEQDQGSPRLGLRTNTAEALRTAFASAGFNVTDEHAPAAGLFSRWTFALRARKVE